MPKKRIFLLTGAPGTGKTTILTRVIEDLKAKGVSVGGMISREIRENNVRVGFEIIDLKSGNHGYLAHVDQKNGPRVGKYRVNLHDLENIGVEAIGQADRECQVVAIDEIGPMELYSNIFNAIVRQAIEGSSIILAVVHAKAEDSVIDMVRKREDAVIFSVLLENRSDLPRKLAETVLNSLLG